MLESPTQEDIVLVLLRDLSAELEQDKKRIVCSDDLETVLAIERAATVIARLPSHPSYAKDVLIALEAHMEVISKGWQGHERIFAAEKNILNSILIFIQQTLSGYSACH